MKKRTKIIIGISVGVTSALLLFFIIKRIRRKAITRQIEEESGIANIDEKRIGTATTPEAKAKRIEMVKKYPKLYKKII